MLIQKCTAVAHVTCLYYYDITFEPTNGNPLVGVLNCERLCYQCANTILNSTHPMVNCCMCLSECAFVMSVTINNKVEVCNFAYCVFFILCHIAGFGGWYVHISDKTQSSGLSAACVTWQSFAWCQCDCWQETLRVWCWDKVHVVVI